MSFVENQKLSRFQRDFIGDFSQAEFQAIASMAESLVVLNNDEGVFSAKWPGAIKFSKIAAIGQNRSFTWSKSTDLQGLKNFISDSNDFVFGYWSYDFRTELEDLPSINQDLIGFKKCHFFVPDHILVEEHGIWKCYSLFKELPKFESEKSEKATLGEPLETVDIDKYVHQVENLKQHIQFGDIYEVNYCVQNGFLDAVLEPYEVYQRLQKSSPAPFSAFVKHNDKYLMCSSPERFIQKNGNNILSQPIKGTNRRLAENEVEKSKLASDSKELSENVMITDLVRNDLSRTAKKGSIKVEELCTVYEFEHVNQMISTVSSELRDDVHPVDAILNSFPMGSMTGAPKIRAMELIDQFEDFSRGLYSGSVGYFTPEMDFDFNVVIRSILYNEANKIVTFPTGSAITINSDPEKEYEECMLKAEAMRNVLLGND